VLLGRALAAGSKAFPDEQCKVVLVVVVKVSHRHLLVIRCRSRAASALAGSGGGGGNGIFSPIAKRRCMHSHRRAPTPRQTIKLLSPAIKIFSFPGDAEEQYRLKRCRREVM